MRDPHRCQQYAMAPPSPPDGNQQKIDPNPPNAPSHKLSLSSQDISEVERPLFEKYWDELDPFDTGKVNLPYIVTFLGTCHLSDRHIQQVRISRAALSIHVYITIIKFYLFPGRLLSYLSINMNGNVITFMLYFVLYLISSMDGTSMVI